MNFPKLSVELQRRGGVFSPGEMLCAKVQILEAEKTAVEAVECSVLWFTVGKGEEDLAVHHFQRYDFPAGKKELVDQPLAIECTLPASPLSYEGVIVKICWCVRARLFLHGGHEIALDAPFRLGTVRAAVVES